MAAKEEVILVLVDDYELELAQAEKVVGNAIQIDPGVMHGPAEVVAEEIYTEQSFWEG
jgi:hypothetical protein